MKNQLPVIVIGAGPVGLAAAAHLLERGEEPLVLEAGERVGANLRRWSHVRMFSPWEFNVDAASVRLLAPTGWRLPDPAGFPTGGELAQAYLEPLAATPAIASRLRLGARVTAVGRHQRDRMKDAGRAQSPFVVRYEDASGEHEVLARAVVDASGTYLTPNPLGASGLPALGEAALAANIHYGIPDVPGADRARYAGRRVLVLGSGHSAFNVLADLATLARSEPGMQIVWGLRRGSIQRVLGGGDHDQLKERGRLGKLIGGLVEQGALVVATGFLLDRLERTAEGIVARMGEVALPPVDEIVATTGFRPDLRPYAEIRLDLDPGTQAPRALAPLIDPNQHSCGSVRPHGAVELSHPEPDLYLVGMKSYGRAPTFLLATGYEQVRSVAAAIAGDWEAARRVELVLPETGVCITQFADEAAPAAASCCGPLPAPAEAAAKEGCCGGPPKADDGACCVRDEVARKAGSRCGCGTPAPVREAVAACCA
ncbi:NAD(P)-binding domain-containing protein [bacterium BD-1]|nr:NAD(P)-binding domain-containing protein [Ottowia caeni]